ncbi:MAG: hypothetical protein GY778_31515, partial [bacterium]|nr:hypothetical protein [bacterium]
MSKKRAQVLLASALVLAVLPGSVLAQVSRPGPLGPVGPPISDLDLENRLQEAAKRNSDGVATLEFSYQSSGDLWSSMKKTNPQGLFVTIE